MEKEKLKRERRQTGVKLDVELLRKFKVLAAERETTLGELIEEAMRNYLQNAKDREER
ncbi:MAG: ribbon-helix-helix protein, CopG family [Syntrophobacteraceae bacterium]|jgi:metal-responsive CopG/Arc/MetJ family transcriptional regulator